MTEQPVGGANIRSEVAWLFKTSWLEVLPLLLFLLSYNHFCRITVVAGFGISVPHSDVNNVIPLAGPKAVQEDISSVIFTGGLGTGRVGWTSVYFFCHTTWVN
jgi:hypothetical protein